MNAIRAIGAERERRKRMRNFPPVLFVCCDSNSPSDPLAYIREQDAIEDDGPTYVGLYQLVSIRQLKKEVVEMKGKTP